MRALIGRTDGACRGIRAQHPLALHSTTRRVTAPITLPRSLMPPSPPRSGQPRTTLRSGRRSSRQLSLPLNSERLNCNSSLTASSLSNNSTAGGVCAMRSSRRSATKRALASRGLPCGVQRMFRARRIIRPMHLRTKVLIAHSEVVPRGWCAVQMTLRAREDAAARRPCERRRWIKWFCHHADTSWNWGVSWRATRRLPLRGLHLKGCAQ